MKPETVVEKLERMVYREFLLEKSLIEEVGLEDFPSQLGSLINAAAEDAVEKLVSDPFLETVKLSKLKKLLQIRDMSLVSKTAAAVSAELKMDAVTYGQCCRMALCYMVIGSWGHVFSALRAAAAKNDSWARHHFFYGLVLGIQGGRDRATWELSKALQEEPYEEGRRRIHRALDLLQ